MRAVRARSPSAHRGPGRDSAGAGGRRAGRLGSARDLRRRRRGGLRGPPGARARRRGDGVGRVRSGRRAGGPRDPARPASPPMGGPRGRVGLLRRRGRAPDAPDRPPRRRRVGHGAPSVVREDGEPVSAVAGFIAGGGGDADPGTATPSRGRCCAAPAWSAPSRPSTRWSRRGPAASISGSARRPTSSSSLPGADALHAPRGRAGEALGAGPHGVGRGSSPGPGALRAPSVHASPDGAAERHQRRFPSRGLKRVHARGAQRAEPLDQGRVAARARLPVGTGGGPPPHRRTPVRNPAGSSAGSPAASR